MTKTRRKKKKATWPYAVLAVAVVVAACCAIGLLLMELWEQPPEYIEATTEPTVMTDPTLPPSPYQVGDFVDVEGYLSCSAADSVVGIDVSHHQEQIDWQQVKDSGVTFVMVRLGYRGIGDGLLWQDRRMQENLQGAREAGLLVGAYFYSQATAVTEAEEEAYYALELLGDFALDLPLAFDWEIERRTQNVDMTTATDCALAFCRVVEEAGLDTMIYFNSYQARQRLDMTRLEGHLWWLAMYTHDEFFPCRFDMWQYTCTGSVPGIKGNVDVNVLLIPQEEMG